MQSLKQQVSDYVEAFGDGDLTMLIMACWKLDRNVCLS